jgi:hypothetical protein
MRAARRAAAPLQQHPWLLSRPLFHSRRGAPTVPHGEESCNLGCSPPRCGSIQGRPAKRDSPAPRHTRPLQHHVATSLHPRGLTFREFVSSECRVKKHLQTAIPLAIRADQQEPSSQCQNSLLLTVLLALVAGQGILNTVLLHTRERVHDLGISRAVGMTPRQTIVMVICWVAGTGLAAGLVAVPAGMAVHRYVLPVMRTPRPPTSWPATSASKPVANSRCSPSRAS